MDFKEINKQLKEALDIKEESNDDSKETLLNDIIKEVKAEIEKIYAEDKDTLEYIYVEPVIKQGHYNDGSTLYGIEVRAELSYDDMVELAQKLDPVVQKYDEYAYFDMVTGGIMEAVFNFDREEYIAPYRVIIEATDEEHSVLEYDSLGEAEDIFQQIANSPRNKDITKLTIEKFEDGEYKVIKSFDMYPVEEAYNDAFDNNKYLVKFDGCEEQVFVAKTEEEAKEKAEKDFFCKKYKITGIENLGPVTEPTNESLAGYKTVAKIIQNDKGFNVAEENDPMLTKDQPTLKDLLNNLVKYL